MRGYIRRATTAASTNCSAVTEVEEVDERDDEIAEVLARLKHF